MEDFLIGHNERLSSSWKTAFSRSVVRWYRRHGRSLPWRETSDPYSIWISEAMLQQTQVATVIDYYHRFLDCFPNVESLAQADEQAVLQLWAGLGYYRRARQLHAASKIIVADFGGQFPSDVHQLQELPGIGRYTAGAIASFAFDVSAPILEANTVRLFSRLILLREDVQSTGAQQQLWRFANWILPRRSGAGEVNQAVMEMGSLLCKPTNPDCQQCPLNNLCLTYARGLQSEIPISPPKRKFTTMRHVGALIRRVHVDGQPQYLMRRCATGEWWQGLWDFPRVDVTELFTSAQFSHLNEQHLATIEQHFSRLLPFALRLEQRATTIRHAVTRYRIHLESYFAHADEFSHNDDADELRWTTFDQCNNLPLTSTARKIWTKTLVIDK